MTFRRIHEKEYVCDACGATCRRPVKLGEGGVERPDSAEWFPADWWAVFAGPMFPDVPAPARHLCPVCVPRCKYLMGEET